MRSDRQQLAYMNLQLMDYYEIDLREVADQLGWTVQRVSMNLTHARNDNNLLLIDDAISRVLDLRESVV